MLLKSDGMAFRPIVHIEDISQAFVAVLKSSRDLIHNQVFNLGITEENYRIRELAEIARELSQIPVLNSQKMLNLIRVLIELILAKSIIYCQNSSQNGSSF